VPYENLPGNPVLDRLPQTPFEKKIPSESTPPPSPNSANFLGNASCSPYSPMKSSLSSLS
jgi:hypothetical protein